MEQCSLHTIVYKEDANGNLNTYRCKNIVEFIL